MSDQTIHLIRPDPVTEGKRTVQGTKLIPQHISTGTLHSSDGTVRCCLGDSDGHHVNELSPLWVAAYIYTTKKTWPPVLSPTSPVAVYRGGPIVYQRFYFRENYTFPRFQRGSNFLQGVGRGVEMLISNL